MVKLDVCDDESVKAATKTVAEKTGGGLDILVNNAGLGKPSENAIALLFKTFHFNTD
jgi:NAD(P)-dependent dehydrogenase (short-subunit alcohol dehydrogenase family)